MRIQTHGLSWVYSDLTEKRCCFFVPFKFFLAFPGAEIRVRETVGFLFCFVLFLFESTLWTHSSWTLEDGEWHSEHFGETSNLEFVGYESF